MYLKHVLGKHGEDLACKYLDNNNYKIIQRNFRCKQGEIDIIALDKNYIVFVEIKSRTSNKYGLPSESVTQRKMKHIIKAATYFLYMNHLENVNTRIDVIEVYVKNGTYNINHLKQVV